jgi:hypothetical protein
VFLPGLALDIEGLQGSRPRCHVGKASDPDKPVGVAEIPELTDDSHSNGFLSLDKLAIKQFDELVPDAGKERVLAQIDNGAAQFAWLNFAAHFHFKSCHGAVLASMVSN